MPGRNLAREPRLISIGIPFMKQHVIVVGGGIVGCMTAMELHKHDCRVTIIERNEIASQKSGESSWAGAGILFPLLPWMYSDEVNRLTLAGAARYPDVCSLLQAETGIDPEYLQCGMLLLPQLDMKKAQAWCAAHEVEAERVPAANFPVQSLSPGEALWLPQIGEVRPPNLMKALRRYLEQRGVQLVEHTQLKPLPMLDRLESWQAVDGRVFRADKFILTSGAWSFELLRENALKLNIKPMRGQILLYEYPLQHMVYREGFYLVPRKDGLLLAGSTLEDVGFDQSTTEAARNAIAAKAEAILPALKGRPILKHWSGLRPGTPENLPTIAEHPTIQNLYLNTGHFRYGLTMAPCSAAMVAAMVNGREPAMDPRPFVFPV
jgi:glycine oxidase